MENLTISTFKITFGIISKYLDFEDGLDILLDLPDSSIKRITFIYNLKLTNLDLSCNFLTF